MTRQQKKLFVLSIAFAAAFAIVPGANAMHIMEGYLPLQFCIAWGVICIPFLVMGFFSIQNKLRENRKNIPILAMYGDFIFVISSLKIPYVTGSCSHRPGQGWAQFYLGQGQSAFWGLLCWFSRL